MSCLTLWPHGLQQGRLACPSPSPRVRSDSRPLCWQYSLTILPSTAPFFCPQSFPASGSFPISRLFASGPWRRKWQPTSLFLPGKSHGMRMPVGYSPWGCKESDTTERLHFHFHFESGIRSFAAPFQLQHQSLQWTFRVDFL